MINHIDCHYMMSKFASKKIPSATLHIICSKWYNQIEDKDEMLPFLDGGIFHQKDWRLIQYQTE